MIKHSTVPASLRKYGEKAKELNRAEETLNRLRESNMENRFQNEIDFMEESLAALDAELMANREQIEVFLRRIEHDNRAWLCANLHYLCGFPWDNVSYLVGNTNSVHAIKVCVYRAFRRVQDEEASCRDAQLSVEN